MGKEARVQHRQERDRRGARDGARHRLRLGEAASIAVSVVLAFFFGYALTLRPVLAAGVPLVDRVHSGGSPSRRPPERPPDRPYSTPPARPALRLDA
jgi:hypothetical protein